MPKKTTTPPTAATRFTDTKRVEELVALMAENGLTEIELVEDKARIVLRRGGHSAAGGPDSAPLAAAAAPSHPAAYAAAPSPAPAADDGLVPIKSPMVGTFYSSPNPESDPYVAVGSEIEKDKTLICIIEAMKVFNEIHAEATGTVAKVLVANGQAVEFGQPLFLMKPA